MSRSLGSGFIEASRSFEGLVFHFVGSLKRVKSLDSGFIEATRSFDGIELLEKYVHTGASDHTIQNDAFAYSPFVIEHASLVASTFCVSSLAKIDEYQFFQPHGVLRTPLAPSLLNHSSGAHHLVAS